MFENLTERLEGVFKRLRGKGLLKEEDVDLALKEVRMALLEADVNFKVVKEFVGRVRDRAVGAAVLESLTPGQQVVKVVHEELAALLGQGHTGIHLAPNPPTVLMIVGLQGSGKTTSSAKLARGYKKDGRRPLLVAADTQRPAAIHQLQTLGEQVGVPVYATREKDSPVRIAREALSRAKDGGHDIVIIDTAGRLHVDDQLMRELEEVKAVAGPREVLLVADAMTGQEAVEIAATFNDRIGIDGVILTKMDGDARGGAALSIMSVTGRPVKFVGVGEKIDLLEAFHPERMASRILGMGDMLTLIEKAQETVDAEKALELHDKIRGDSFNLEDLRDQLRQVRKMGPLKSVIGMIPGVGSKVKDLDVDERQFDRIEAIVNSMTPKERRNYAIINASRRRRIATGSGTTVADVNRVLKEYIRMRKMMKRLQRPGKKGRRGIPQFPGFP